MTTTLDPSGFNIEVKIGVDGEDVPLWVRNDVRTAGAQSDLSGPSQSGEASGSEPLRDLAIVESVTLELNLGLSGKTTIQIGAPYELGIRLLNSRLLRIGNVYKVRLGYPKLGRFTPWFNSTATKPNVAISPEEGLSVTLNGQGGGFAASRGASPLQTTGTIVSAIQEIADQHGWSLQVPKKDTSSGDDPLYRDRTFSQEMRSNWRQLQYLARQAQCDAYLGPAIDGEEAQRRQVLYIVRRADMFRGRGVPGRSGPLYTFVMRGRADFKTYFPILNYSSEFENVWLPRAAIRTSSADITMDGEEVSVEASGDTAREPALGDAQPSDGSITEDGVRAELATSQTQAGSTGEHLYVSVRDPATPQDSVNSHQFEAQVRGSIQCQIQTFAIPELWPSTLVQLRGIGFFSGLYAVESMTHTANATEWMADMKLIANALSSEFVRSGLAREPSETNDQEPTEPISDDDPTSGPGSVERNAEPA